MEIVEHDRDVVVEASSRVEMEAEGPTTDQGDSRYISQPEGVKTKPNSLSENRPFLPSSIIFAAVPLEWLM